MKKGVMEITGWQAPKQVGRKEHQMHPEMHPKSAPETEPLWTTRKCKTIAIPYAFAQNGAPKGPRY